MNAVASPETLAWQRLCARQDLVRGSGIVALLDGQQVAVFQTPDGAIHALENRDPRSGANVIGRGLIGQAGDVLYVAAPLYKQRFGLADGVCLDDPTQRLRTWRVRVQGDVVEIA